MSRYILYIVFSLFAAFSCCGLHGQTTKWRDMHKVKKKETIFGIAREYGITVEQLKNANPEMKNPDYKLKKGDFVFIPFADDKSKGGDIVAQEEPPVKKRSDMRYRALKVGVMLPLHDENGDGKRMVEYYRGILLACDSLKQDGISVDMYAWNMAENADVDKVLADNKAAECDLIIGPLYSKQVPKLSSFVSKHDIRLFIPFSISTNETSLNKNIFQAYQNTGDYNEAVIERFAERYAGCHTVIIDCNDTTSTKWSFTSGLRKRLEAKGAGLSISNLQSSETAFAKAFSRERQNVVVLNTGSAASMTVAFAKLNNFAMNNPDARISVFGYTEWLSYTRYALENYYKFDACIPAPFYNNALSQQTRRIEAKYRGNFHDEMMRSYPRFAITGFDHAYYLIKGLHSLGDNFTGARGTVDYSPIQTPLHFQRMGNGGYKNNSILFIHYTPDHRIETLSE